MWLFTNFEDQWIGASYQTVGQKFTWQGGVSLSFTNWLQFQPGQGACMYMLKNLYEKGKLLNAFQWASENCTFEKQSICEMTAIQCPSVPYVNNAVGDSKDLSVGTTLTYTCLTGHNYPDLSTVKNTTCQYASNNVSWSVVIPPCVPVKCPTVTNVLNTEINTTDVTYLTNVKYSCITGYEFPDGNFNFTVHCQANKTWTQVPPPCQKVVCPPIPNLDNSLTIGNGTLYQDTFTSSCNTGYMFNDRMVTKVVGCTSAAKWNESVASCQPLTCADFDMAHVQPLDDDMTFQSVVRVTCQSGFRFPDNDTVKTVECTEEATWNETIPDCDPIQCPEIPPGVATQTNDTGTGYGTIVLITCPEGEEFLDGNTSMKIQCDSHGHWKPFLLSCAVKLDIKALKSLPPKEAPEAAAIGTPTVALLVTFVCIIIILDITTLQKDLVRLKRNLKYFVKEGKRKAEREKKRERFRQIYGFDHPHM